MSGSQRLWTIQAQAAWERATDKGYLAADGRRAYNGFRPAYRWLMNQMALRITGHKADQYPVWCWTHKPDLRKSGYLAKGTNGVCIEFEIEPERVLMSSFDYWHSVLNRSYLALNQNEMDSFRAKVRHQLGKGYHDLDQYTPGLRRAVEQSWQRIFDIEMPGADPEWTNVDSPIQAVVSQVNLDQIRNVRHFVAR